MACLRNRLIPYRTRIGAQRNAWARLIESEFPWVRSPDSAICFSSPEGLTAARLTLVIGSFW